MKIILTDPVFGKNLRYLRKQHCLSREALAKLLGVSEYKIWQLEATAWPVIGITLESDAFFRLGEIFSMDANKLLSGDPKEKC